MNLNERWGCNGMSWLLVYHFRGVHIFFPFPLLLFLLFLPGNCSRVVIHPCDRSVGLPSSPRDNATSLNESECTEDRRNTG
ncbi:uncharacterized protein BO72DRAFT_312915 [Aspergillus fijiensis CBS 313.89]|uniref:Uncharacterized protein n=1 Tax=Aspergillus fijiensis CBS 313.89 TaxID=1448319 RepID=A0A8G1RGY1_9EURO|nr:uncharacterized protein BO72DRAFT_312915 [Aspergillus fijiensis CBS 313.89]RAK71590.1 hypothetical protein BO72DRAFT_312915 [Aspergillus fijiensis CBS 313.89]